MQDLEQIRVEIDAIDKEMSALFQRRMDAAAAVARYKQANGLPILDQARENAVIEKNARRFNNPELEDFYTDYLKHLMSLSRQYQARLIGKGSAAYQGVAGGFGHQVACMLFPHATLASLPSFAAVFEAVEAGDAAFGVVPFENSTTGDVSGILDLLYTHNCYITAMYDLPVHQNLLGLPGSKISDIKTIVSHEQSLSQSKRFLDMLNAELIPFANNGLAAKHVAETKDPSLAAVASLEAGELYGLVPLAADIASEGTNTTRFIIISKEPAQAGDRFSLLITVENRVGTLADVINSIAASGYNMENIKSRPMPKRPWEYYFYIELLGSPDSQDTQILLESLGRVCLSARTLGCYTKTTKTD